MSFLQQYMVMIRHLPLLTMDLRVSVLTSSRVNTGTLTRQITHLVMRGTVIIYETRDQYLWRFLLFEIPLLIVLAFSSSIITIVDFAIRQPAAIASTTTTTTTTTKMVK